MTQWRDFAENDGSFLEKLKDDKPILGLCDVKASMYKGIRRVMFLLNKNVLIMVARM